MRRPELTSPTSRIAKSAPSQALYLCTALLDAGYSPATVLRQHRIPSRALTVARQRGHVARNIVALVDPPAQKHTDVATALNLGEARAVLTAAMHVRNSARWTVALALQWKDIDLLTGTLTVRRSIHRVRGGGSSTRRPGGRAGDRAVGFGWWECASHG
jgi:integrase